LLALRQGVSVINANNARRLSPQRQRSENDSWIARIGADPAHLLRGPGSERSGRFNDARSAAFAESLDHLAWHCPLPVSLQDESRPLGSAISQTSPPESLCSARYRRSLGLWRSPLGDNSLAHLFCGLFCGS